MKTSPTSRVLLGLVAGAAIGLALARSDPALAVRVADLVQPVGRLWLNALQMTVVPLVLALVVVGVTTASDAATSGRTARRSIVVFLVLLSAGAAFAAVFAPLQLSLLPRDPELIEALRTAIGAPASADPAAVSFATRIVTIIHNSSDWLVATRDLYKPFNEKQNLDTMRRVKVHIDY